MHSVSYARLDSNNIADILRSMAWERAKGELNSILSTYYGDARFETIQSTIQDFTKTVEDNGLC